MTNTGENQRHERVIEPDCHAQGLIHVGDTSQPGVLDRLQHEFDSIGRIMPDFKVTGFDDFGRRRLNRHGYPAACVLYRHDWDMEGPKGYVQTGELNDRAFDLAWLHSRVPVNWHTTADLTMRYIEDDHHCIVPDWKSAHAYFSAMRLDELEREQMLMDDDDLREGSVVALIERRSGFVLPLPANSAVSWMYFGDGSGVEIFVRDGISLRWQMDTYPEYFDPDSTLNEDDVELDISNCLDLIERIQGGFLNPRTLTDADMPPYPVRVRDTTKERK